MAVMIGVDPHKRSHTAVVVDGDEVELDRLEERASRVQVDELLGWAARFGDRHLLIGYCRPKPHALASVSRRDAAE
jgi:hypothetical protein